jgi:hypothetical protein
MPLLSLLPATPTNVRIGDMAYPGAGYRFTFTDSTTSDITVDFTTDGNTWTPYQEPAFPPNASNRGQVLALAPGTTVYIYLKGPATWQPYDSNVWVILARANSAASGQAYSPLASGAVQVSTALQQGTAFDSTVYYASLGALAQTRGKFEITIAFSANLSQYGIAYFSEDPEMDVQGAGG